MNLHERSSKPVLVCAFGLLAAFLMPWANVFGAGVSGYNLARIGSYGNYAWVIPILAGATLLTSFAGVNNRTIGAISGLVPLSALAYALLRVSAEGGGRYLGNAIQFLGIGAWLTIIFSVAIVISAAAAPPEGKTQG